MPLNETTILALNHQTDQNQVISRLLERAGCKVVRAHTGTEALALAAQQPSLILLDVHLPDVNGFEVCRRLRSTETTAQIRVLFVSDTPQDYAPVDMAEAAGADGFLFHPVQEQQLLSAIEGKIAKSKAFTAGAGT